MKVLPIDPVFANCFNFNTKHFIINCSTISKSFEDIYFFFEKFKNRKVCEKTSQFFFSVSLRSLLFSNFQLAMFCFLFQKVNMSKREGLFYRLEGRLLKIWLCYCFVSFLSMLIQQNELFCLIF